MSAVVADEAVPDEAVARPVSPAFGALGWARRHPDLVAVAGVALVAALLRAAFLVRAPVFVTGDSEGYLGPAFDLARGLGLELGKRTPAYPAFVAAAVTVAGEDLRALAFVQHLLGVTTAALTYWLGRLTFGRAVGVAAGLLTALNGALVLAGQTVMTEALFVPLVVATLATLVGALRTKRLWLFGLAGLLLGLAALTRPVAQVLLPVVLLTILVVAWGGGTSRGHAADGADGPRDGRGGAPPRFTPARGRSAMGRSARRVGLFSAVVLAGFGLSLVPSAILSDGDPGGGSDGGLGQALVGRTARHDRGAFTYFDPALHAAEADPVRLRARQVLQQAADNGSSGKAIHTRLRRELGLTAAEADRLMRELAVEAILRRPDYYLQGTLQRFARLGLGSVERPAAYRNTSDVARQRWEDEETRHLVVAATPAEDRAAPVAGALATLWQPAGAAGVAVALLAVVGLVAAFVRPSWRPALAPGLAALALLAASAALVGNVARYRFPVDPLLAVLAAGAVAWIVSLLRVRLAGPRSFP